MKIRIYIFIPIFFLIIVNSVEATICINGDCLDQQQLHEFDKIQNYLDSSAINRYSQNGERFIRWPKGSYRETGKSALCINGNCITEWPPRLKNFELTLEGEDSMQRYVGRYFVFGRVAAQDYYRAGVVLKYNNQYKRWLDPSTASPPEIIYTTPAFSDTGYSFETYLGQSVVGKRNFNYLKSSRYTDLSNFACNKVSTKTEYIYNDKARYIKFEGGRDEASYRGSLTCKIRHKSPIGLEAVYPFAVGKFELPAPKILQFNGIQTSDGKLQFFIFGDGYQLTAKYVAELDSSGQEKKVIFDLLNDPFDLMHIIPYPAVETSYRFVIKNSAGVVTAEFSKRPNYYGPWRPGPRWATDTLDDGLREWYSSVRSYQSVIDELANPPKERKAREDSSERNTRQKTKIQSIISNVGSGITYYGQNIQDMSYIHDPEVAFEDTYTDHLVDSLPPCSPKPNPLLIQEAYPDLSEFYPAYRCFGKAKHCLDVLPDCHISAVNITDIFNLDQIHAKDLQNEAFIVESCGFWSSNENKLKHPDLGRRWLWDPKRKYLVKDNPVQTKVREVRCEDGVVDTQYTYSSVRGPKVKYECGLMDSRCREGGVRSRMEIARELKSRSIEIPTESPTSIKQQGKPINAESTGSEWVDCSKTPEGCNKFVPDDINDNAGHLYHSEGHSNDGIRDFQRRLNEARRDGSGTHPIDLYNPQTQKQYVESNTGVVTKEEAESIYGSTTSEQREEIIDKAKEKRTDSAFSVASIIGQKKCKTDFPYGIFHVCYFSGINAPMTDASVILQQPEWNVPGPIKTGVLMDNSWGTGVISATKRTDDISGVWRGQFLFEKGTYSFFTVADDGVEVWFDDTMIIQNWADHGETENRSSPIFLDGGFHTIMVRWYEKNGGTRLLLRTEFIQ
ncbi:hypothetical protein HY623_01395 [Candidatus Uhrbacteria bacterium]|nr:hypothetical protein [Candidatus Uhrbacteria bacterium]